MHSHVFEGTAFEGLEEVLILVVMDDALAQYVRTLQKFNNT